MPVVALAGAPNVGKSTVFNALTGLRQHTGNWPGKTVVRAEGIVGRGSREYLLVDTPGTYSLLACSSDEEAARDFICFGHADAVIVVCSATNLERDLNLALQVMETTGNVVVCVNLMDEARRKGIRINCPLLEERLGVPVVPAAAARGEGLKVLAETVQRMAWSGERRPSRHLSYGKDLEPWLERLDAAVSGCSLNGLEARWASVKLLEGDEGTLGLLAQYAGNDLRKEKEVEDILREASAADPSSGESFGDRVAAAFVERAERLCQGVVILPDGGGLGRDRRIDKVLMGRWTAYPLMFVLLVLIFWITIVGANYPSQWLANLLGEGQEALTALFRLAHAPEWLHGVLVLGVYRVVAWVVSVMLPPMAIFFPLFTLLEDSGYLPRVAFNMDKVFQKCCGCGKQALTMCMGFGCNAAGITGCRIIDSPRERLVAILTNNFVPCNGRFPTLIALMTMFFAGSVASGLQPLASVAGLVLLIGLGVGMTFAVTALLSHTILKGTPSSFTLELPPYRKPQIGKVIVRSFMDRTLTVLWRAVMVAAPAGIVIWLMANIRLGDASLLVHGTQWLDPAGRLMGLDGVILMAFILGIPANEIVFPLIIMGYLASDNMMDMDDMNQLKSLLTDNGWTWVTALCTMLFSLMHWPCSTAVLTVRKETGKWKWALLAFAIPTVCGVAMCILVAGTARLMGFA
ncbi:ferrous iron transport protein B [Akkermansia muciniphila]|nr:ferrous iron transport protein B [Akkermansia muciniphila]MBT8777084.1 ferrous iron transport protein B [Akkermansia muciniphila]